MSHHGPELTVKMQAEYAQFSARKSPKVATVYYTTNYRASTKTAPFYFCNN